MKQKTELKILIINIIKGYRSFRGFYKYIFYELVFSPVKYYTFTKVSNVSSLSLILPFMLKYFFPLDGAIKLKPSDIIVTQEFLLRIDKQCYFSFTKVTVV